jgi:RecB family exonuclease
LALYIRDPYQFYEQRLLKIKPDQEYESDINAAEKGTIIHKVLEELYDPYVGKVMEDTYYKEMLKKLSEW